MRKAIIETATGSVKNIIEIELAAINHWVCPDGCELIDDGPGAGVDGIWDGATFTPPVVEIPRIQELMSAPLTYVVGDEPGEGVITARPAADLAAEDDELMGLLTTRLEGGFDLSAVEVQRYLQLDKKLNG